MPKRLTRELFIERSNKIHNNRYDYSLVEYINSNTKIKIICPHGIFEQRPDGHLSGKGCVKCSKQLSHNDFIKNANKIHSNKYDYSLVKYNGSLMRVDIICPKHGVFKQTPNNHLYNNSGCQKCGRNDSTKNNPNRSNLKEFIKNGKKIHNNKYSYDKSKYINSYTPLIITCPEHGDFEQIPDTHNRKQCGCRLCADKIRKFKTPEEFIYDAKKIHGELYDYTSTVYIQSKINVDIICKKHGAFNQRPMNHLQGAGCPSCGNGSGASKGEIEWLESLLLPDDKDHRQVTIRLLD